MRRTAKETLIGGALLITLAACAAPARADYAVLRSGLRLHITGYETDGAHVRLTVEGGTVDVLAADLVSVEPEDHFEALPPSPVTSDGPYAELDPCRGAEAWPGRRFDRARDRDGIEFQSAGGFAEAGTRLDAVAAADSRTLFRRGHFRPGTEH